MRLEGSIDAFSLPDIFSLLSMTKKTGGLHLRREGAHGVVWFTTGAVTGGASDVTRQTLARRVVGATAVDEDVLQQAIERADEEIVGVGRALQLVGAVDEGVLHEVASEHVVDTVFDLLRWSEGDFAFVVDEANPDDVGVSRAVDEVVTEARRRLEIWTSVAAAIPSPQTVLSLVTVPVDDPQLSGDEWALLALVDGQRSVGSVVQLSGRGDFAVVSTLAGLVDRGLLRTDGAGGVGALVRRNEILAAVERAGRGDAEPTPVAPRQRTDADLVEVDVDEERAPTTIVDAVAEGADADVVPGPSALATRATPAARPAAERLVTPARSEPFLPPRQVEHPEPPSAVIAAAGGAVAVPAASPYIERDPSVNKSLLLRLIAGVRGL